MMTFGGFIKILTLKICINLHDIFKYINSIIHTFKIEQYCYNMIVLLRLFIVLLFGG